ncbi:MAG TPA: SDR family NAD(P)-dependent oxidoreductase, partial [Burkholderiales bacterium]|nr:SDR family NAD(P)-dependent oxidoreductase [Burkholderiales bacterium]
MRLTDKVAIITGGGSGIGQATAVKFAREGAKVVVGDLAIERADETVRKITEDGGEAMAVRVDVRDKASIVQMVEAVVAKYGRIDCLVN